MDGLVAKGWGRGGVGGRGGQFMVLLGALKERDQGHHSSVGFPGSSST